MSDASTGVSRRTAVRGIAVAGVGVPLLAACAADDEPATGTSETESESAESPAEGETSAEAGAAGALAATADIPVGGGAIFADEEVVVTQPTEGDFKCFSAICTHQGCVVSGVTETIDCVCHRSAFSIEDGSVQAGPATAPLEEVAISVEGDSIILA